MSNKIYLFAASVRPMVFRFEVEANLSVLDSKQSYFVYEYVWKNRLTSKY